MKMTTYRAQQHNSTSGKHSEKFPCTKKKLPLIPQVHTVDIPGNAILTHG
jgi:hypothetical protein